MIRVVVPRAPKWPDLSPGGCQRQQGKHPPGKTGWGEYPPAEQEAVVILLAEEQMKGANCSCSPSGLGGQRLELPGNKENLVRGKEDASTGAQKLGIGVRGGPCGILDRKDAARRQRQNGWMKHGAPVRFYKADRGPEHFALRGLESHWAERRQGAAGRDAAN